MRQRLTAREHDERLAEIDLHLAGMPGKVQESFRIGAVLLPPPLHVALHSRIRAVEPVLVDQPVEHAPGGMPLLGRHAQVRLEPRVHDGGETVHLRAPATILGRRRAQILHIRVLGDRGAVHAQTLRDPGSGHSLTVESSDILLDGHRNRHCPFLPEKGPAATGPENVVATRESTGSANRCLSSSHITDCMMTRPGKTIRPHCGKILMSLLKRH